MKFDTNEHITTQLEKDDEMTTLISSVNLTIRSCLPNDELDTFPDPDAATQAQTEEQRMQIIQFFYGDIIDTLRDLRSTAYFAVRDPELSQSVVQSINSLLARLS